MVRFGAKRCFFQNSGFSLAKISEILKWPKNAILFKKEKDGPIISPRHNMFYRVSAIFQENLALGQLNDYEQGLVVAAAEQLEGEIAKGVEFASNFNIE